MFNPVFFLPKTSGCACSRACGGTHSDAHMPAEYRALGSMAWPGQPQTDYTAQGPLWERLGGLLGIGPAFHGTSHPGLAQMPPRHNDTSSETAQAPHVPPAPPAAQHQSRKDASSTASAILTATHTGYCSRFAGYFYSCYVLNLPYLSSQK
jgi:hypothetical protein